MNKQAGHDAVIQLLTLGKPDSALLVWPGPTPQADTYATNPPATTP